MKQEVYDAACNDRLVDYIIELLSNSDSVTIDNANWEYECDNFRVFKDGALVISVCDGYINDMPNDYYVESPSALRELTLILYNL